MDPFVGYVEFLGELFDVLDEGEGFVCFCLQFGDVLDQESIGVVPR